MGSAVASRLICCWHVAFCPHILMRQQNTARFNTKCIQHMHTCNTTAHCMHAPRYPMPTSHCPLRTPYLPACNPHTRHNTQVRTEAEAVEAITTAKALQDHFIFIEVIVDKRDAAPASAALRTGFMKKHFSAIPGYHHMGLDLPGCTAGAGSTLTGHEETMAGGLETPQGSSGPEGDGYTAGAVPGGPSGGVDSPPGGAAAGTSFGLEAVKQLHHVAGSSSCLAAAAEGPSGSPSAAAAANGGSSGHGERASPAAPFNNTAATGSTEGAGVDGVCSRVGVLPAKRRAEDLD